MTGVAWGVVTNDPESANVPPTFSNTETLSETALAVARSVVRSPLKSAATMPLGEDPTG